MSTLSLTPGTPTTDQTLTATATIFDPDPNASVLLTYVWQKTPAGSTTPITIKTTSNTTSLTDHLDLSVAGNGDEGDTITVKVTPTTTLGVQGGTSSSSVTIVPSLPVVNSVTITPPNPAVTTLLTATVMDSDADGVPVTLKYVWFQGANVVQSHLGSSSLTDMLDLSTLTNVQTGQAITVQVTPIAGPTTGVMVPATVVVGNTAPSVSSLTLTPSRPTTNAVAHRHRR